MPWERKTVKDQRKEFTLAAAERGNFSALCREWGITRKTGYKWLERSERGESLSDQSRKPHSSPGRTPAAVEQLVLALRQENPGWGAKTLHNVLTRQGHADLPCPKTVNNILHRYDCISQEATERATPYQRFEKARCNQMWQTDFKGEFRMGDKNCCHPLNILDDHSRFSIKIAPAITTKDVVIPAFLDAFRAFGLPESVLSDNGAQFAGFRKGFTQFERWLMDLDILPIHGRIRHPQTQGKIERFHRSMKSELLQHQTFSDIEDAKIQFAKWRDKYNFQRPHTALNMRCPGEVYVPSERALPERIERFEYTGQYPLIKVNNWGYARFACWQVYLSETMANTYLEFRTSEQGDCFLACYRNFKIAAFNAATGQLNARFIARL